MSHFCIDGAKVACKLYDQYFREACSTEQGSTALVVSFSTYFADHGYEEDGSTLHGYGVKKVRYLLHLIFTNVGSYVSVWAYKGSEEEPFDVPMDEWENIANHDSEWRSAVDDYLTRTHFKGCEEAQSHLPQEFKKASRDVHYSHMPGRFMEKNLFEVVEIEFKNVDNYKKALTVVKPSKKKLSLTE